jgi:hypothetical protein
MQEGQVKRVFGDRPEPRLRDRPLLDAARNRGLGKAGRNSHLLSFRHLDSSLVPNPEVPNSSEYLARKPDLMQTLKRLEVKKPAIPYYLQDPIIPDAPKPGRKKARNILEAATPRDYDSDEEEDRVRQMVDQFNSIKKVSSIAGRHRLESGFNRLESGKPVLGDKHGINVRNSREELHKKLIGDFPQLRPFSKHRELEVGASNYPLARKPRQHSESPRLQLLPRLAPREEQAQAPGRSRIQSNYSSQPHSQSVYPNNSSAVSFSVAQADLNSRFLTQIQKALELREKGRQIHQALSRKEGSILSNALNLTNYDNKPKIKLHLKPGPQISKIGDLEFAKLKGKYGSKVEDWASHVAAGEFKNSEEQKYVISNLKRIDEVAQAEEEVIAQQQKRPGKGQAKRHVEDRYLESIRAKFSFLEA